jgi:hypothetical protein
MSDETKPPERIDPAQLGPRLIDATGPLPAGTPVYDSEGYLIATLGESVQADDDGFEFTAPLNRTAPPVAGGA